jgi:multicomponent Na+:H+ antiporter subunit A
MQQGVVLLAAVLLPFFGAAVAPWMHRKGWNAGAAIALIPALFFVWLLMRPADPTTTLSIPWVPEFGLDLNLRLDGLAWPFALLISLVGAMVFLYSSEYLQKDPNLGRFYASLASFMGAMLGIVLSDNVLLMVVFWELTSITSFLLIGYDHEKPGARRSAIQAMLMTGSGGLIMMAGVIMLGQVSGTFNLSEIALQRDLVQASHLYPGIVLCLFAGAFTKSAQVPLHFWLPNAMAAPTPVSAYLHSATMVQAGVYLMARTAPTLGGTPLFDGTLIVIGSITAIVGAVVCVFQNDLKKLLAYSTVGALGTLIACIGERASSAFLAFFIAHGLYKGGMFLMAGILSHATHTLDAREMGGLAKAMPRSKWAAWFLGASMAALPLPIYGFVAKELILHDTSTITKIAVAMYGAASVVAAYVVGLRPFIGKPVGNQSDAHDPGWRMLLGPWVFGLTGLVLGILAFLTPPRWTYTLTGEVVTSLEPMRVSELFGAALVISLVSLGFGAFVCRAWNLRLSSQAHPPYSFDRAYTALLSGTQRAFTWLTLRLQHGYLNGYIRTMLVGMIVLVWIALFDWGGLEIRIGTQHSITALEFAIGIAMIVGAFAAVFARSRLGAVAALGIVGYGVGLVYVFFSAPDLAMTQLAVETLTLILFVFTFYYLPRRPQVRNPGTRIRDGIIATAFGATIGVLAIFATYMTPVPILKEYFEATSVPGGMGRNIVNVILVDFRALDTMGEITVLAVAALGVFALLKFRRREVEPSDP